MQTWITSHPPGAIQPLGEDSGRRRLSGSPNAGKKVRVMQSPGVERGFERPRYMLLPCQIRKRLRSVFSRDYLITQLTGSSLADLPTPPRVFL